jgi:outer membrane immunogenic protein
MGRSKLIIAAIAVSAIAGISAASAADMPVRPWVKDPVPVATSPLYDWSGFYAGVEGGGSWGTSRHVDAPTGLNDTNNFDVNGGLGGVTAGINWQTSSWVFGLEGDVSWVGQRGSSVDNGAAGNPAFSSFTKEDWLATIRGRVGFAANNALFYATGGWAIAGTRSGVYSTATGTVFDTSDDTRNGWTVGGGIEWGFLPDWSAKVEYLYVNLENKAFNTVNLGAGFNRSAVTLTDNIVRVGVNWRFTTPSVTARY